MYRRYLNRNLTWAFILILGFLAGCSNNPVEGTPSNPQAETLTAAHPMDTQGPTTSSPTQQTTSIPPEALTTPIFFPPYRLLKLDEFSFVLSMDTPIPTGYYLVSAESLYSFETKMHYQVTTFSGDVASSLEGELIKNGNSFSSIFSTYTHRDSNRMLVQIAEDFKAKELYVVELETMNTWGITLNCETALGEKVFALGSNYLAFRCWDETHTWHFVNTANPSESFTVSVPIAVDPFEYSPIWVGANDILFKGESEAFCLGSIPDWDPFCDDSPYWVGKLQTDAGLLEIREGNSLNPTAVGVISTNCLQSELADCHPILIEHPFNDPQTGVIVPLSSTWVPGTTSILYLVVIDHDPSTNAADETELWLATFPVGTMEKLDVLDGEFVLAELGWPQAPAIWLPSGKEVVLNGLDDLIIYNIETGEQRSIGDPGTVLGTIEIK